MDIFNVKIYFIVFCINLRMILCDYLVHDANRTLAEELEKKVKILCAVIQTDLDPKRQTAIDDTFGKRCNKLTYIPSDNGCIQLTHNVEYCGDNKHEWELASDQRLCLALYEQNHPEFEWYILMNARGYIIAENMRYMLADHNPDRDIYFMSNVRKGLKMILSRKALDTFAHADINTKCNKGIVTFDSKTKCFSAIGLMAADSRDSWGRDRILPDNPYVRFYPENHKKFWYCDRFFSVKDPSRLIVEDDESGDCFSDFAVSFDSITAQLVYVVDFLIYQLRPYGVNYRFDLPNLLKNGGWNKENHPFNKMKVNSNKKIENHNEKVQKHLNNIKAEEKGDKSHEKSDEANDGDDFGSDSNEDDDDEANKLSISIQ